MIIKDAFGKTAEVHLYDKLVFALKDQSLDYCKE